MAVQSLTKLNERYKDLYGPSTWAIARFDTARFYKLDDPPYTGWVYFVQAGGRSGPVKIGYTSNDDVERRVASLQTGNAVRLHVRTSIRGSLLTERQIHDCFHPWRMQGEWFRGNAYGLRDLIEELEQRIPGT